MSPKEKQPLTPGDAAPTTKASVDSEPTNDVTAAEQPASDAPRRRQIRSFVRREGRLTPGQRHAIEVHGPRYCIDPSTGSVANNTDPASKTTAMDPHEIASGTPFAPLNFNQVFGRAAPVILEIGFGNGDALFQVARANPDINYLGIEVHRPGVGVLLAAIADAQLENVRIVSHDAVEVLKAAVPDASLTGVNIFFPDPWHKKRHHKRRLVQPSFVELLHKKLVAGGFIHLATDWEDYAVHMRTVFNADDRFSETDSPPDLQLLWRPETKFERRGKRLGHGVWDLVYNCS